jgi:hypothetical protein
VVNLLVVEDEERIASFLSKGLRAHGYTVEWVSTGRKALQRVTMADISLVILDLGLPDLDAVRGGWRKGVPHAEREYLPLTAQLLASHLSGEVHAGPYPLLDGDRCWWLAADFDGPAAMLDALAYLKAARSLAVPAALEVSRSGVGAHAWVFFTGPVPAETARRLGTGLLREAMALRGQMDLASYDRLFPSQDVTE